MENHLTGPGFGTSKTLFGNSPSQLSRKRLYYTLYCKLLKAGDITKSLFDKRYKQLGLVDIFYVFADRKSIPW